MTIFFLFILLASNFINGMDITKLLNAENVMPRIISANQFTINAHKETNEIFCKTCNKKFKNNNSLNHHIRNKICQNKECPYCPATFLKPQLLLNHLNKIHKINPIQIIKKKGPKCYQCSFCKHSYPLKGVLVNHLIRFCFNKVRSKKK